MKKSLLISLIAATTLVLTGCGSNDSNAVGVGGTSTAKFIDSAVAGLSYDCHSSGESGTTDSEGNFNYVAGDECTFSVGSVTLGSAEPSGSTTTPRDLTSDDVVFVNILRFLQTLDTDENPDNGITLPTDITGSIDFGSDFDAEIQNFMINNNIRNAVVSSTEAKEHFEKSIDNSDENDNGDGDNGTVAVYKVGDNIDISSQTGLDTSGFKLIFKIKDEVVVKFVVSTCSVDESGKSKRTIHQYRIFDDGSIVNHVMDTYDWKYRNDAVLADFHYIGDSVISLCNIDLTDFNHTPIVGKTYIGILEDTVENKISQIGDTFELIEIKPLETEDCIF